MKKKLNEIKFVDCGYSELLPTSVANMTHYKLKTGGVILTSNKSFKHLQETKIFIPYSEIRVIY